MELPLLNALTDDQKRVLKKAIIWSTATSMLLAACVGTVRTLQARQAEKDLRLQEELTEANQEGSGDSANLSIVAHRLAARHFMDADLPARAIGHLQRLRTMLRGDRSVGLDLGTALLEAGRYKKALALFKELLDEDVADSLLAKITARYGRTLFYAGESQESHRVLIEGRSKFPASAEILCYLGELEAAAGKTPDKALDYFQQAIVLEPAYAEARYQQARYFMRQKQYARSRDSLLVILQLEPMHVRAHSRLGMTYYYMGEPEMAKKSYETALALNGDDFNTHYNLGEVYLNEFNDPQRALKEFKATVRLKPTHPEANFKLGLLCLGNNMYKEAAMYLERSRTQEPGNIRYLMQLGVAYERLGSTPEALEVYRGISAIEPLNDVARQKVALLAGIGNR